MESIVREEPTKSSQELGSVGVTPDMPLDAVLALVREFRIVQEQEGVPDPVGSYLDEIAGHRPRSPMLPNNRLRPAIALSR